MSKAANPGELRTPVYFFRREKDTDADGDHIENLVNVFGEGKAIRCKWVNAHGSEVFDALQQQLREPATITCRYSAKINRTLEVQKGLSDTELYEIISVDDVEEKHKWMEIKVQRKEAAR